MFRFPIENEPQYSPDTADETGLLVGTVGNPTFAFPDPIDNDWFNGDEGQDTYVEYTDVAEQACLNSPQAVGALQFLVDLKRKHKVARPTQPGESRETREWFRDGRIVRDEKR